MEVASWPPASPTKPGSQVMGCLTPGEGIRGYESSLVANALRAQIGVVRRLREPMCCSSGRKSDVGGFFVRFLVVLSR